MADLIGQRLGNYEITGLLGEGGMATVYRARQLNVRRDVAIKVIEPRLAKMVQFARRFEREADTIASLNHAHILKLFDFGQEGELVYLVMELLEGGSLTDLIRKGPLSLPQTTRYLTQIAAALDYAHSKGVIHRDLKPHNVLLDESGDVRLTDFGIAKVVSETTSLTQTGAAMGTPAYMSPEQLRGMELDARSDVYSLGILVYEMLTGGLPFKGDTPMSMMYLHLNEAPTPIRNQRSDLPEAIQQVVNIALAKDREDRFQSAGSFAQAFQAAINGQVPEQFSSPDSDPTAALTSPYVNSAAISPEPEPESESEKPRRGSAALIIGMLGLMGLVAAGVFFLTRSNAPPTETTTPPITSNPTVTAAVAMQSSATPTLEVAASTATVTATATETPIPPNAATLIVQTFEARTAWVQQTLDAYTDTPTPDEIATGVAMTETAIIVALFTATPTATLTATTTSTPTWTLTATVTPTWTPTITLSPTATLTPTLAARDMRILPNGIELVYVPAGCFKMGSGSNDEAASPDERPQHEVCITKPFWIGRYEITNAEYQQFIEADGYFNNSFWSYDGWNWKIAAVRSRPTNFNGFADPKQPRVGITWYEAEAFAAWAGGRLPTEAEWEYAARARLGGRGNWFFPWGNEYQLGYANVDEIDLGGTRVGHTSNVGSYPDGVSWVGAYDMAGNAWEWSADWYDANYYISSGKFNPKGAVTGTYRIARGGSWLSAPLYARTAYRNTVRPTRETSAIGMRIVIEAE